VNNPPYTIENIFTDWVAAVATVLGRPVYSHYEEIRELNQTLKQYNEDPASFDKKYPLVLLKQPVTVTSSKWPTLYAEVPELTLFIITGSDPTYKRKEREDNTYTPIVDPIVTELKNQIALHPAILGYRSQLRTLETKYPYWGENQQNVLSDVVDVLQLKVQNLKIQNNLNC
jgi:hypothetical protein